MQASGDAFSAFQKALVKVGEDSGKLPMCLNYLAGYEERRVAFERRMVGATVYPAFVLSVSLAFLLFLPPLLCQHLLALLEGANLELNPLTQAVIGLNHLTRSPWFWLIFATVLIRGGLWVKSPAGARQVELWLDRTPWLGPTLRSARLARFARALSIQVRAGIHLDRALGNASQAMAYEPIHRKLQAARAALEEGQGLSQALLAVGYFPSVFLQFLDTGEETGKLDVLCERVAEFYEAEFENRLDQASQVLEPLIMAFLGGVVALLVLAIGLPMAQVIGSMT